MSYHLFIIHKFFRWKWDAWEVAKVDTLERAQQLMPKFDIDGLSATELTSEVEGAVVFNGTWKFVPDAPLLVWVVIRSSFLSPTEDGVYIKVRRSVDSELIAHMERARPYMSKEEKVEVKRHSFTFEQFRIANKKRCEESFFPIANWDLNKWMAAVVQEVGEAAQQLTRVNNIEQRAVRPGAEEDKEVCAAQFKEEIGDIMAYLDLMAQAAGTTLEDCTIAKFNAVSDRVRSPVKFVRPDDGA